MQSETGESRPAQVWTVDRFKYTAALLSQRLNFAPAGFDRRPVRRLQPGAGRAGRPPPAAFRHQREASPGRALSWRHRSRAIFLQRLLVGALDEA